MNVKEMSDKKFKRNGIILEVVSKGLGIVLFGIILWRIIATI